MPDLLALRSLVLTTDDLLGRGLSSQAIGRAVESGDLVRLRRGCYVEADAIRGFRRDRRHLLDVVATELAADRPVFSHWSAAALHGLPTWALPLDRVAVTAPGLESGGRRSSRVRLHRGPLTADEVVEVSSTRLTSIDRTLVDVARTCDHAASVCVLDAALHSGVTTEAEVEAAIERSAGRTGCRRARVALHRADPLSESVAETRSRLVFASFGLPTPELQVVIPIRGGRVRVDFLWRAQRVIGECDGLGKYVDGVDRAESVRRLRAEKSRESELYARGFRVVRWQWSDPDRPDALARMVGRVLDS